MIFVGAKVGLILTFEMFLKYRISAVAGTLFLAGCLAAVMSIVVAQEAPAKVATAQRETLTADHAILEWKTLYALSGRPTAWHILASRSARPCEKFADS